MMQRNLPILGLGAVGLGAVGLAFHDFALQWQPVPASVPMRPLLAVASAAALLIAGGLASAPATRRIGGYALAALLAVWLLLLHVPLIAASPAHLVKWLGLAEIGSLFAGALAIVAMTDKPALTTPARILLGLCAVIFGASHFVYASFTAAMVPAWIPAHLFWAYATGAGHTAAGVALVAGVLPRLAATLLALMCGSFALLLHLPRVAAAPSNHGEWVMLFIAICISGGAWAVRDALGASHAGALPN